MRLIFSRRETYTGQRPSAGTLNFGSGAALASWALERVNVCQLSLIYFWIAQRSSPDALSAADSDETKGEEISNRIVMRKRSEEHTSELQSPCNLVCRLLLEK